MGCCIDTTQIKVTPQDQPLIDSKDPLLRSGDIFENLNQSKDIEQIRKKLEEFMKQIRKNRNKITSSTIQNHLLVNKRNIDKYQKCIIDAAQQNPITITNLINWAIELNPCKSEKINTQGETVKDFGFLKGFIYLYTGDYFYQPIRKKFTTGQYTKAVKLVEGLKKQISRIKEQVPDLFKSLNLNSQDRLKANSQYGGFIRVFRGINNFDIKVTDGNSLYSWRSFTSTSLKINVAEDFAKGGKGITLYKIQLNKKNPHDHVLIPPEWSQYPRQQEVLLFPLFNFVCVKKTKLGSKNILELQQYDQKRHQIEEYNLPKIKTSK